VSSLYKSDLTWRIGAILLILIVVISRLYIWTAAERANSKNTTDHFNSIIQNDITELQNRFEIYADTLYSGRAFIMSNPAVSRQSWTKFVDIQNISKRYPGVNGIGYATVINSAQIRQFNDQLNANRQASDSRPFAIYPASNDQQLAVLTYLAPEYTDQNTIGYNLLSSQAQVRALDSARDTGLARASQPIQVVQGGNTSQALMIIMAVYNDTNSLSTITERQSALKGYVILSLYTQAMLDSIFKAAPSQDAISLKAYTNHQILYNRGADYSNNGLQKSVTIDVAGQPWLLIFTAPKNFGLTRTASLAPNAILISSIPFLVILCLGIYFALNFQKRKKHGFSRK
jgi:CHASE1-domain containing sensor protein